MRTSELCRLDRDDLDLQEGVLTVRDSKYGKHRQVPVHSSTTTALRGYLRERDRLAGLTATPAVFITTRGTRLDHHNIPRVFARLVTAAEIPTPAGRRRPRLHDLRHSFAVATLLDWYRDGVDAQARMPLLSTYLGHKRARSVPLIVEVREMVRRRIDAVSGRPDARLFTGPRGGRISTAVLRDATHWDEVVTALGYEHLRRHGLRHTPA